MQILLNDAAYSIIARLKPMYMLYNVKICK